MVVQINLLSVLPNFAPDNLTPHILLVVLGISGGNRAVCGIAATHEEVITFPSRPVHREAVARRVT